MNSFDKMGEAILLKDEGQRQLAAAAGRLMKQWIAQRAAMAQGMLAERRSRHQTAKELSSLTDRELGELGFSRADLPYIANGTYQR
jgi:uncharacterized protein YjiS (DUF1127 family)